LDDAARIAGWLVDVEQTARQQRWDAERPWRTATHIWLEDLLPVVDLHDLGARPARRAAEVVAARAAELDAGAVVFVTGRGRHSAGQPVLGEVVQAALAARVAADGGSFGPRGAGRIALVVDPERAPAAATGRLSLGVWLLVFSFAVAALWVCLGMPGAR
jgi:hypothetical protein